MNTSRSPYCVLIALLLFAVLGSGCSGNIIPLKYERVDEALPPCTTVVALLPFEDARVSRAIGEDLDGEKYYPETPVEDWITAAFFEELDAAGCSVLVDSAADPTKAMYSLTGTIMDVRLHRVLVSNYTGLLKMKVVLKKHGEVVYNDIATAYVEHRMAPTIGVKDQRKVMKALLQEMMKKVLFDVLSTML